MTNKTTISIGIARRVRRGGFSLVEVLLAMFILGIGLIMVATIFPVGADWTRQAAEDSTAQNIAQNALSVIKAHYRPGGDLETQLTGLASAPNALQALPGFTDVTKISLNERAYQYGARNPFPALNPQKCNYFWTALVRVSPGQSQLSSTRRYDLYILVFRKGAVEHTFNPSGQVPGLRNGGENFVPTVVMKAYAPGAYNANATPAIQNAVPPIGTIGIGLNSGTVFRQGTHMTGGVPDKAEARPNLSSTDGLILYAPPADNTNTGSPLIYVYQTTLTL